MPVLLSVLARRRRDGRVGLIAQRMSVPRITATRVARAGIQAAGSASALYGDAAWLSRLGVRRSELDGLRPVAFAELDAVVDDASTAASLTNMHPEIVNLDDLSAAQTTQILLSLPEVDALGDTLAAMREEGELAYWLEDIKNPDGSQAYLIQTNPDLPGFGEPMVDPDTGGPAIAQTLVVSPALDESYGDAVRAAITAIKGDPLLEGSTYYVTPGQAPAPQDVASLAAPQTDFGVAVSRSGWNWGTQVTAGPFDPTTRSIPLKIYNNWERLLQVHVQYFADNSTMLPVDNHDQDPNGGQGFRSTPNSEYLTYVADMPTSFGIPWAVDVNYSEATITLPDGANYARLLICGPAAPGAASGATTCRSTPTAARASPTSASGR